MRVRQTYLIAGIIFICFLSLSLSRLDVFGLDETGSHFPNALNFYHNGFSAMFNTQYSAANTPLPYVVVCLAARLTSPSLLVARIVTCMVSFLMFLVAMKLVELYGCPRYLSFTVLFYPYLFVNSFLFYAVNYGLLFALLAMLFLHRTDRPPSYAYDLIAGMLLAMAVLCQQFYLVIPAAVLISRVLQPSGTLKQSAVSAVLLAAPMIVPFILFYHWGGLTHPNFREHAVGFYPSTVVAILTVTGFYFAPFLLQSLKSLTRMKTVMSIVMSVLLVLAIRPTFTDTYGPGAFAGVTHHLIALTGQVHFLVPILLSIGLTLSGILVMIEVYSRLTLQREYILFISCLLLAAAYSCFTFIGERHLLGFVVFLFLLVLPWLRKPLDKLYPAGMAVVGVSYFVWWFFFKWASM